MKQVTGLTSTYSSDTFGVCSALYELGGMVVMHDASGCNSTYTTHDEPRWYSMESMIYISALSEKEAVTGDDEKLIRDVTETALALRPKFIALAGAPVPFMTGTDFQALAALIEKRSGIPAFGFDTNGMRGYLTGISMALRAIVRRFCRPGAEEENGRIQTEVNPAPAGLIPRQTKKGMPAGSGTCGYIVNIIGATPLDFSLNGSVESIKKWLTESGFVPGVCLAMGSPLEEIARAGEADVNLVVSYGGLAAARELEKTFGTPWVAGVPAGKLFAAELAEKIKEAARTKTSGAGYMENSKTIKRETFGTDCSNGVPGQHSGSASVKGEEDSDQYSRDNDRIVFIGESIFGGSLARAIALETGKAVRVLCPLETEDFLLRGGDLRTPEEDDLLRALPAAATVIADPLYRRLCRPGTDFRPLRHVAFSGRLFGESDFNLINKDFQEIKTC